MADKPTVSEEASIAAKMPFWADWLLTAWVLVVAIVYFGGYFLPALIGRYTSAASALYALMLLICALVLAFRYLGRPVSHQTHPKKQQTRK